MKSSGEHLKSQSQRRWFAQQYCISAQLPFVLMGIFDSQLRSFAESWFGSNTESARLVGRDMAKSVEARLGVYSALDFTGDGVSHVDTTATDEMEQNKMLVADDYLIGVSAPIGHMFPVVAFPPPRGLDLQASRSLMNVGLAHVTQQLIKSVEAQTRWPAGTVEAAMQVLSVDFLVVTAQGKVCYDSRRASGRDSTSFGWMFCNGRLSLSSDKERSVLDEAIRGATSAEKRTSMISVMASPGVARLVVVTPLVNSNPPTAMLLFDGQHTDHFSLREQFFSAYGLTRAERMIAHELLCGHSIAEAAEAKGLSTATVRSYMKQVFAKTGIHRQSELISLYYTSILPVTCAKDRSLAAGHH
jgi:DNA-binding CsgD family transcriptional regulator